MASVFFTRSGSLVELNYPLAFKLHTHENSILHQQVIMLSCKLV